MLVADKPEAFSPRIAVKASVKSPVDEGWLYIAVIMALYSRRIIGWAFAHHLGTELVAAALVMALLHHQPPQGLVHHSDRGVRYASAAYRNTLKPRASLPA
jgi:putative transposase